MVEIKDLEEFGELYEAYIEKKRKEDELAGIEGRRKIYLRKKLMNREARGRWESMLKWEFDKEYLGKNMWE